MVANEGWSSLLVARHWAPYTPRNGTQHATPAETVTVMPSMAYVAAAALVAVVAVGDVCRFADGGAGVAGWGGFDGRWLPAWWQWLADLA